MANFYQQPQQPAYSAQNLQFYPSSYGAPTSNPSQARYSSPYGGVNPNQATSQAYPSYGTPTGFMSSGNFGQAGSNVAGRMGEQGGLRTGWLAAFGTEGYDGEPPLLEELGVNFGHIKVKVSHLSYFAQHAVEDAVLASIHKSDLDPRDPSEIANACVDSYCPQPLCTHRPTYNG